MAKRTVFCPKVSGGLSKKPRLDVSIVSSYNNHSTTSTIAQNGDSTTHTTLATFKKPGEVKSVATFSMPQVQSIPSSPKPVHNVWDDDDDEFIILASQAVEADIFSQKIINASSHLEVSYSRFSNEVQTSTQHQSDLYTELKGVDLKDLDQQQHNNDDEDDEALSNWCDQAAIVPGLAGPSSNHRVSLQTQRKGSSKETSERITNSLELVAQVQKDNAKLKADYSELCEKLQTKEGEVSTLRYKMQQLQHQNDEMRLEKCQEAENVVREHEKSIKSLRVELDLKSVELLTLKCKRDTQRGMNQSITDAGNANGLTDNNIIDSKTVNYETFKRIYFTADPQTYKFPQKIELPAELFFDGIQSVADPSYQSKVEIKLQHNLRRLQNVLSQLQAVEYQILLDSQLASIEDVLCDTLNELSCHVKSLKFSNFSDSSSNTRIEHDFLKDQLPLQLLEGVSVCGPERIYIRETGIVWRRIFMMLSYICRYSNSACMLLVSKEMVVNDREGVPSSKTFFNHLLDILNTISYSFDLYAHMGIITATSHLLNSLALHFVDDPELETNLFYLFKGIVFCRPVTPILVELSKFLRRTTSKVILSLLCTDSESGNFTVDTFWKIYEYSPDSCVLQVYGSLLSATFPQFENLRDLELEMLFELTRNTMIFFRRLFQLHITWLATTTANETSPFNNETATSSTLIVPSKNCKCYVQLGNSCVILLHFSLYQWVAQPHSVPLEHIQFIAQTGILLLNELFHSNAPRKEILTYGSVATSQRLQLIYEWFNKYNDIFKFKKAHLKTLGRMDIHHITSEPLRFVSDEIIPDGIESSNAIFQSTVSDFFQLSIC